MAKLSDLIKRATRDEPGPMGFGAAARKTQATMLLFAVAGDHWSRAAADAVGAGADAVLLTTRPSEKDAQEAVAACDGHPCGVVVPEATADQLQRLREAGVDFAVIGGGASAGATTEEELTLGFHLRDDLSDMQLRALESLPFEAIYIDREAAPVTVTRLVELRRIAGLARKLLLIHVAAESQQADLVALRDAGVTLVAVDMKDRSAIDALRRLREMIDGLPRRQAKRGAERARVSLPRGGGAAEHDHEEDEDDE